MLLCNVMIWIDTEYHQTHLPEDHSKIALRVESSTLEIYKLF